ncbi:PAQR family membrane homeostasis protein TrhA [Vulgatibacter sp.]|uniref:PAQR family membrane homeostasis protein TrhA n=1 Tax=Vulgatibacter sp. TaxID=1971226 RepID=UPI003566A864
MDREREESWNAGTHAVGTVLGLAGAAALVTTAAASGDPWRIVSVAVFGTTLVLLYLASTLYHATRTPAAKARLRILDHASIYLLIAGTYTPFTLLPLRGGWGWSLFGVVWGLAAVGVVAKLFLTGRFRLLSTLLYVGLGWVVVVAIVPLVERVHAASLAWLFAGGLTYTLGTLFYVSRRLPYAHAIWHLFVLGGSACHTVAVALI